MNAIEKIKLTKQLNAKVDERNVLTSALAKLKLSRVIEELREKLGLSNGDSKAKETGYADVLVRNSDGKLLLVQRKADDSFKPNHWWIAGGHIENNETPEDAAIRELKEETSISANNVKFLNTKVVDDGKVSHRFTYITDSQDVKLQKDELSDFAWVTIEDAKNYQLVGEYSDLKSLYEKAQNLIELNLPENPSRNEMGKAVNQWLKNNAQGKMITAVDGKKIKFNASSTKHLTFDGRYSEITARTIPYVIDVFTKGVALGREELNKERNDGYVAFHAYEKWVELIEMGLRVHLQAKAGERESGDLETDPELIAYHQKVKTVAIALPGIEQTSKLDSSQAWSSDNNGLRANNSLTLDDIQADFAFVTILEITDLNGNPIDLDQETQSSATPEFNELFNDPNNKDLLRNALEQILEQEPILEHKVMANVYLQRNKMEQIFPLSKEEATAFVDDIVERGKQAVKLVNSRGQAIENEELTQTVKNYEKAAYLINFRGMSKGRDEILTEVRSILEKANAKTGYIDLLDELDDCSRKYYAFVGVKDFEAAGKEREKARDLRRKLNEIQDDFEKAYSEHLQDFEPYKKVKLRNEELEKELVSIGNSILSQLYSYSSVTDEQVKQHISENVSFKEGGVAKIRQGRILADCGDFYRLTNGRIKAVKFNDRAKRANTTKVFEEFGAIINGDDMNRNTVFHELAHNLEFDPKAQAIAQAFLLKRRESDRLISLSHLTGVAEYGRNEKAYKDHFIDPYIGKYYEDGSTEVFSMALGYLSDPKSAAIFAQKDPEMFNLVVAYLADTGSNKFTAFNEKLTQTKQEYEEKIRQQRRDSEDEIFANRGIRPTPITELSLGIRQQLLDYLSRSYTYKKGATHNLLWFCTEKKTNVTYILTESSHIRGQRSIKPKLVLHEMPSIYQNVISSQIMLDERMALRSILHKTNSRIKG